MAKKETTTPDPKPETRNRYVYNGATIIKVGSVNASRGAELLLTDDQAARIEKLYPNTLTPVI